MLGPLLEVEMWEKCTPLWREARLEVKPVKTRKHVRFGRLLEVEMLKKRTHIFKSKVAKHVRFGARLEVEMLKKCTRLRREARLEVKSVKTRLSRTTFGSCNVEKVHTAHRCGARHIWK